MNNSFKFFIQNTDLKYKNYLKSLSEYPEIISIYETEDPSDRENSWIEFAKKQDEQFFEKVANPFYIGFGNPQSDILIIGKESGYNYDTNEYKQFYKESVNNIKNWEMTLIKDQIIYNLYPERKKLPSSHTWSYYKAIVERLMNIDIQDNASFLDHCFITEINHVPSKTSKGRRTVLNRDSYPLRKDFLKDDFFKQFKYIINTAKAYETIGLTEELFDVEYISKEHIGSNRKIESFYFRKENRSAVVTCQMSGSTRGLTTDSINKLCDRLKGKM
ncbi:MAG TPA: hypothetical protein VIK55_04490 [Paludibacter sp.]